VDPSLHQSYVDELLYYITNAMIKDSEQLLTEGFSLDLLNELLRIPQNTGKFIWTSCHWDWSKFYIL